MNNSAALAIESQQQAAAYDGWQKDSLELLEHRGPTPDRGKCCHSAPQASCSLALCRFKLWGSLSWGPEATTAAEATEASYSFLRRPAHLLAEHRPEPSLQITKSHASVLFEGHLRKSHDQKHIPPGSVCVSWREPEWDLWGKGSQVYAPRMSSFRSLCLGLDICATCRYNALSRCEDCIFTKSLVVNEVWVILPYNPRMLGNLPILNLLIPM